MRVQILMFILLFFLFQSNPLTGQCTEKSLDPNFDEEAFAEHLENFQSDHKKSKVDQVPITLHIIETTPGNSGLNKTSVDKIILTVNRYFKDAGVEFYLCGAPRIIAGNQSYTRDQTSDLNRSEHVLNTINIYLVEDYISADSGFGGFAFFPWTYTPNERYVTMTYTFPSIAGVLAHELGHLYGLFHTHETFSGIELVDGSNCLSAGDMLCDTPADFNLGRIALQGCSYSGSFQDPNGNLYSPDPSNIMSYAPSTCLKRFTTEQAARINFYHERENNYLKSECIFPDFIIKSSEVSRSIRSDENLELSYQLDLVAIDNISEIEVYFWLSENPDQLGTIFQKDTITIDQNSNSIKLDFDIDFPINRSTNTYYLTAQVDPEFKVLEQEEANNLYTIQVNVDNSKLEDEVLFANPVIGQTLKLFLRNKLTKTDLIISIWDHMGRLHYSQTLFKNRDEYFEEIDVSALRDGLYILEAHYPDRGKTKAFNFYKHNQK